MRKLIIIVITVVLVAAALPVSVSADTSEGDACWGQISKYLAQTGDMGEHSSEFAGQKRLGLANLARQELGEDASLQDLGVFLNAFLGLGIEACQ